VEVDAEDLAWLIMPVAKARILREILRFYLRTIWALFKPFLGIVWPIVQHFLWQMAARWTAEVY
jgi:hypothetical protein